MKCESTLQAYLTLGYCQTSIIGVKCYAESPSRIGDEQTASVLSFSHAATKFTQNADVRAEVSFTSYKLV